MEINDIAIALRLAANSCNPSPMTQQFYPQGMAPAGNDVMQADMIAQRVLCSIAYAFEKIAKEQSK